MGENTCGTICLCWSHVASKSSTKKKSKSWSAGGNERGEPFCLEDKVGAIIAECLVLVELSILWAVMLELAPPVRGRSPQQRRNNGFLTRSMCPVGDKEFTNFLLLLSVKTSTQRNKQFSPSCLSHSTHLTEQIINFAHILCKHTNPIYFFQKHAVFGHSMVQTGSLMIFREEANCLSHLVSSAYGASSPLVADY